MKRIQEGRRIVRDINFDVLGLRKRSTEVKIGEIDSCKERIFTDYGVKKNFKCGKGRSSRGHICLRNSITPSSTAHPPSYHAGDTIPLFTNNTIIIRGVFFGTKDRR